MPEELHWKKNVNGKIPSWTATVEGLGQCTIRRIRRSDEREQCILIINHQRTTFRGSLARLQAIVRQLANSLDAEGR